MAAERSEQVRALSLKGFGAPATPAAVTTSRLSLRQRLLRGGRVFGLGLASALLMLPIPIIHLIGPPIAILLGLGLGIRRLGEGEIFVSAEGSCPFCHTSQPLGLAGSRFRLPCDLICSSCRQPLRLEVGPAETTADQRHG
jgi:hypothetical protein